VEPVYPPCLTDLDLPDQRSAASFLEEAEVEAGQLLMHDDYEAHCLAYVVRGEVEVHLDGAVVGRASAGEWVGESALFPQAARKATVFAVSDCWLLALPTEGYVAMRLGEHRMVPGLEREILAQQLDRLRAVGERLAAGDAGRPHPPGPGLLGRLAAQLGPGGLLSGTPLDAAEVLRAHGLIEPEESAKVAARVARHFAPQTVAAGTLLCREGEAGDEMYVLHAGSIDVLKARSDDTWAPLATLRSGAAFGLSTLHSRHERMASCVAAEGSVLLRLDRDGWQALVRDDGPAGSCFRRAMIRVLAGQLAETNALVARLADEPTLLGRATAAFAGGSW